MKSTARKSYQDNTVSPENVILLLCPQLNKVRGPSENTWFYSVEKVLGILLNNRGCCFYFLRSIQGCNITK